MKNLTMHRRPLATAWFSLALIVSSPAAAREYIVLSNQYGGSTYIGFPHTGEVGSDFSRTDGSQPTDTLKPRVMTGSEITELFTKLCLAVPFSREAYDTARSGIAKDFATTTIQLASSTAPNPLFGSKTQPAVEFLQEEAPYGFASLWLGEKAEALPGRQSRVFYPRGVFITSIGKSDFYAPQCNLTLQLSGFTSTKILFDEIQNSGSNFKLIKRVEKPKYGVAVWTLPAIGGRVARISAGADALDKSAQSVHITIQLLPVGKIK